MRDIKVQIVYKLISDVSSLDEGCATSVIIRRFYCILLADNASSFRHETLRARARA